MIHEAYLHGDLEALKAPLGDPPGFPNCHGPRGTGENILEYAIYWNPMEFVRTLLKIGADPNYVDPAGFPALLATLAANRSDKRELIELLLSLGVDIEQRGLNDWTPLHYAVALGERDAVRTLLDRGADPNARTRIDELSTPRGCRAAGTARPCRPGARQRPREAIGEQESRRASTCYSDQPRRRSIRNSPMGRKD